jgi:hypothetical protein
MYLGRDVLITPLHRLPSSPQNINLHSALLAGFCNVVSIARKGGQIRTTVLVSLPVMLVAAWCQEQRPRTTLRADIMPKLQRQIGCQACTQHQFSNHAGFTLKVAKSSSPWCRRQVGRDILAPAPDIFIGQRLSCCRPGATDRAWHVRRPRTSAAGSG